MNEEEKIWKLREELNKNKLNIDNIRRQIKQLTEFDERREYNYLNALMYPEKIKGVRIPSKTPIPTCTFQLKSMISVSPVTVDSAGRITLIITPYFLGNIRNDEMDLPITVFNGNIIQQDKVIIKEISPSAQAGYYGNPNSYVYNELQLGQSIDTGIYNTYRLVSACLKVSYIGPLDQAKGIIGGGVYIGGDNHLSGRIQYRANGGWSISGLKSSMGQFKFDFNTIRQLPYYREVNCLEGLRMLYFPIDNKSLEFKKIFDWNSLYQVGTAEGNISTTVNVNTIEIDSDDYDGRFAWIIIGEQLPTTASIIRLELYCNFECTPEPKLLNYIPISINSFYISENDMIEIWKKIKDKCVEKLLNN